MGIEAALRKSVFSKVFLIAEQTGWALVFVLVFFVAPLHVLGQVAVVRGLGAGDDGEGVEDAGAGDDGEEITSPSGGKVIGNGKSAGGAE